MHQLDPAVKTIWGIRLLLRTFFLAGLAFAYEFFTANADSILPDLNLGMLTGMIFSIGILCSFIVPVLQYRYWKFEVRDDELYLERGVLTRVRTVAPIRRIQHLDVSQNVLENMLGVGKLVIYTAGTRGADIIIPGLPYEYAEALRDRLKNHDIEDAV